MTKINTGNANREYKDRLFRFVFGAEENKAANPRRVELVCLKNRFGISSYTCNFEYFPQFDLFRPIMPQNISGLSMENADPDGFVRLPEGFNTPFDV